MDWAPGGPNPCMHAKRLANPAAEAALAADLFTAPLLAMFWPR